MTDDAKMQELMKRHAEKREAAHEAKGAEDRPLADVADDWALDDRDARLVCPECKKERTGKVPKRWWAIAAGRGEEDPYWRVVCDGCIETNERKPKGPPAPEVSENLDIEFPTMDEGLE